MCWYWVYGTSVYFVHVKIRISSTIFKTLTTVGGEILTYHKTAHQSANLVELVNFNVTCRKNPTAYS